MFLALSDGYLLPSSLSDGYLLPSSLSDGCLLPNSLSDGYLLPSIFVGQKPVIYEGHPINRGNFLIM